MTKRAKKIKLLIMDVDGVLTDGRIIYANSGDELKFFDVTDGMGLSLFARAGLKTAILTAKGSRIVLKRSKELHIDKVYQNAIRKADVFKKILSDFKLSPEEICFIGDDLVDIPVLKKAGFAVAVPNACREVKDVAHHITKREGGRGAVREVIELILKAQGKWDGLMKRYLIIFLCFFLLIPTMPVKAQPPTPSAAEEGGAIMKEKPFEGFKPKPRADIKREDEQESPAAAGSETRFLIEHINVEGNTVLPEKLIKEITSSYENKELSLDDLNEIAKKITDLYAAKGYVTSQAYVPPQTIAEEAVTIKILEGKYGNFYIEGVENSNEAIIRRRVRKKKSELFSYNDLRDDLLYLNQSPDRIVRSVMDRGKEPGTTDLILKVKDRPPIHPYFNYDNTGNKTTGNWRYTFGLEDNSLLGWDDRVFLRFMRSDTFNFYGWIGDYTIPVNEFGTNLGISASYFRSKIGGADLEDSHIVSWSGTVSPFIQHPLFDLTYNSGTFGATIDAGMDIEEAKTKIGGVMDSRDKLRVMKSGISLDESDSGGRTQLRNEVSISIPNFLDSMDEEDIHSSRAGAGGNFIKYTYALSRIQSLPYSMYMLLSAAGQASNNPLISSEQYRIGGMYTVRGYDEGHSLGDYGNNASAELRYPFYFIPDSYNICGIHPRRALQGTIFVDWGFSHLVAPNTSPRSNHNLVGVGLGGRINMMNCISGRYDVAWPVGDSSVYGRSPRAHISFTIDEPSLQEYEQLLDEMMYTRIEDKLAEIKKEVPPEMADSFEKAKELDREGRYEEAKVLYAKVVEMRDQIITSAQTDVQAVLKKEQDAELAFEAAQKYQKEGNLEKAKEEYSKVLQLASSHAAQEAPREVSKP